MNWMEQLKLITKEENIFLNEPMSKHTSFKTGGNADVLVIPDTREEIIALMELDAPKLIIGNGTNLLVKDGGIRGLVIQLTHNQNYYVEGKEIEAESGISIARLSHIAYENGLTGLEFACGIPGTLGGAIVMNAGAYGGEMSQVVIETEFLHKNGIIEIVRDHKFAHRKSLFMEEEGIILSSRLKLALGDKESIKQKMDENRIARNTKQPIQLPSAGSTFKRPEGYFVGKLIEEAGLKGYRIGGAEVSTLHAGFVVNQKNATSKDILLLIQYIQDTIKEKYNVILEPEVQIIGED